MKRITINQFLTDAEIARAVALYGKTGSRPYAQVVCDEIIQPNIARINAALGQENDPKYLAYAVEYVISQSRT